MVNFHDLARKMCCWYPTPPIKSWADAWERMRFRNPAPPTYDSAITDNYLCTEPDSYYADYRNQQLEKEEEAALGFCQPARDADEEDRMSARQNLLVPERSRLDRSVFSDWRPTLDHRELRWEGTDDADKTPDDSATTSVRDTEEHILEPLTTSKKKRRLISNEFEANIIFSTTRMTLIMWCCLFPFMFLVIRQFAEIFCLVESMVAALIIISYRKHKKFNFEWVRARAKA